MNIVRDTRGRFAKGNMSGFVPLEQRLPSEQISLAYLNGESSVSLAKRHNTYPQAILEIVRERKGDVRSLAEAAQLGFTTGRRKSVTPSGSNNTNWKGDLIKSPYGYLMAWAPNHPRARNNRIPQHILVWERVHSKSLPKGWVIHHMNGVKDDNRPANLMALPTQHHNALIPGFQKRIRELEVEIKLLQKALEANQMIFYTEN